MCYKPGQNGKTVTEYRTPSKKETDLIFAVHHNKKMPAPGSLYNDLLKSFGKTLDRVKGVEKMVMKDADR